MTTISDSYASAAIADGGNVEGHIPYPINPGVGSIGLVSVANLDGIRWGPTANRGPLAMIAGSRYSSPAHRPTDLKERMRDDKVSQEVDGD